MKFQARNTSNEDIVTTTCSSHCAGGCVLKVHVSNGVITRIETDDGKEPQLRACLKGRAYRQRVYAPDRLTYPLKRVGERGEGKFKRVSWDEALETVASELKRVKNTYGPEAIFVKHSAGDEVLLNVPLPIDKLLSLFGGFSVNMGSYSFEQGFYAELATLGSLDHNGRDDLLNSRLIILWGCDPANTTHHTNTTWYVAQARDKGIKIICIDPRFTDTAANFASQWIPIIPGTDCALMAAIAYVMIKEGLYDREFLDKYTVGFEKYKAYVMGEEDGVPKSPAWAEAITSVPAATIENLAREYATTKPAALITGIAPGRTAFGEQYHRAAITLAAMTGNIGKHGGGASGRSWPTMSQIPAIKFGTFMRNVENPVIKGPPANFKYFLPIRGRYFVGMGSVYQAKVPDALLKGKSGGYPSDYKLLFIVNHNFVNQMLNTNKTIQALKKMEFVVTFEQFVTPTAKWSDVVLPTCTFLERNDFIYPGEGELYYGCQKKVIEPIGECKTQFEIAKALADKLGLTEFAHIEEEEALKEILSGTNVPDYAKFRQDTIYRAETNGPYVAFQKEIEDPEHHPFPTPSGKIEIYSQQLADMNDPLMPPVPKYIETWENRNDPLAEKYPLQLLTVHFRRRAHSQNDTIPWLRETQLQGVQINVEDARERGIANGDMVRVFNDRGVTQLPALVTRRILKGVVTIPEGAWYDPDEDGVDRGGGPNVLTRDEASPGGGYVTNTCLVQVKKV